MLLGKTVGRGAVAACELHAARETVTTRPSLPSMAEQALHNIEGAKSGLAELAAEKPERQVRVCALPPPLSALASDPLSALAPPPLCPCP